MTAPESGAPDVQSPLSTCSCMCTGTGTRNPERKKFVSCGIVVTRNNGAAGGAAADARQRRSSPPTLIALARRHTRSSSEMVDLTVDPRECYTRTQ